MLVFKGYIRSSRLFLLVKRPESAQRMIEMASERVAPDDAKRAQRLALLREEIEAELDVQKRRAVERTCHISKLPYEIISEIILCVAETTQQSQILSTWVLPLSWPLLMAVLPHRLERSLYAMEEHCNRYPSTLAKPSTSNKKYS